MTQTKAGAIKAQATVLKRYGLTADGKSKLHSEAGKVGGKNGHNSGFALNKKLARRAGKLGGIASGASRRAKLRVNLSNESS